MTHGLALMLLQIFVIVIAGRLAGRLLGHFRQPRVIGEVAAGILLGPSFFGHYAPKTFESLFPAASIPTLQSLSQVGLILFMFLVGLEFAPGLMRKRHGGIVAISHCSIIVPFLLGLAIAPYLYARVSEPGVPFRGFALFLGTAMSITAFPVLARILEERHLLRTRLGNTAIACAAVDDVTAWCILAGVVMIVRAGRLADLAVNIALVALYVVLLLTVVRPLLKRIAGSTVVRNKSAETVLAGVLLLVIASSFLTEVLGIHALFGAFIIGAILPREASLTETLTTQTRSLTTVLFLPLFFAVTGLRCNVGLLREPELWICGALVLAAAVVGKLGSATISARLSGMSWREATAIGVLMNTRGLMEMVVVNIGRDVGVISQSLFTMIVMMALITTGMAAPILDRLVHPAREVSSLDDMEAA